MEYSVVIRTLGKGGEIYQKMLESLMNQTIQPSSILVYIAEGYPLPKETIGKEKYIFVKKGMVAQRALSYKEVHTEYILFLDDDVYLPANGVETLYNEMIRHHAQVIAPDVFANNKRSIRNKLTLSLLGREFCRVVGNRWSYKVLRTAGFSYNNHPEKSIYEAQSNSGPCFFCRKKDFLNMHFEEELWLDNCYYAFPEDQIMYYKMFLQGMKLLTIFHSGIVHMDARSTVAGSDKTEKLVFSEYRNKLIFWHRFIYSPEKNVLKKIWSILAISYFYGIQGIKFSVKGLLGNKRMQEFYKKGTRSGWDYIHSSEYRKLPAIIRKR